MAVSSFTRYPVFLVSDRQSWADRILPICRDYRAVVEAVPWSAASTVSGPVAAVVADVAEPFEPKAAILAHWAGRLWYPLCLVSLAPDPGAAEFLSYLRGRGYERIEQTAEDGEGYGELVRSGLEEIFRDKLWLVPVVAERLGTRDALGVRALCAALENIPDDVTVDHWARRLGFQTHWALDRLFRERRLPSPKDVLTWIRVLTLVEVAERSPQLLSVGRLAREFNFGSGKHLRRRIREVTGHSLEAVMELGFEDLLDVMQEKLAAGRAAHPD